MKQIAGVTFTKSWLYGTFQDKKSNILYPAISWQTQKIILR